MFTVTILGEKLALFLKTKCQDKFFGPIFGINFGGNTSKFIVLIAAQFEFKFYFPPPEGRPFQTLCHLDPWFNNMLFHYGESDSGNPDKVLMLDFQLSAFTNPGNDLVRIKDLCPYFSKLPSLAGSDLTTHSSSLLGGRRSQCNYVDHAARSPNFFLSSF
jgi:hypothetical protein